MTKTKIMGILNLTPDSFYEPSRVLNIDDAVSRGLALIAQGAEWVDIGGESTRPGAAAVTEADELARVLPVVQALAAQSATPISIDTSKPAVAAACVAAGAKMINDVTGFTDPAMRDIAAASQAAICVMHMQGTPRTMQQHPDYPDGVIECLLRWFDKQVNSLLQAGVKAHNIFLDPGIGFGKTVAHNVEILQNLPRFMAMGYPLLLGVSRKSFMSKILDRPPAALLPTTLAVNTLAIRCGVDIIRVHDVAEHRLVADLLGAMEDLGRWSV